MLSVLGGDLHAVDPELALDILCSVAIGDGHVVPGAIGNDRIALASLVSHLICQALALGVEGRAAVEDRLLLAVLVGLVLGHDKGRNVPLLLRGHFKHRIESQVALNPASLTVCFALLARFFRGITSSWR